MKDLGIGQMNIEHSETREFGKASNYTYFADNDVLLAKITPCFENGKLGIAQNLVNGIGFSSSEYFVFRPNKDVCRVDILFLSQKQFRLEGSKQMTGEVGHKRVSKDFITNYKIPLPPLEEQQRIVGILDDLFEKYKKIDIRILERERLVSELFQSLLDSFTDSEHGITKTLIELTENHKKDIVDGPFGSNLKREHYVKEGTPVLKIQNIKPFEIRFIKWIMYPKKKKFN